ncbi:MAG: hypothetical protein ABW005_10415 [Burkholderiaceae bacterium]
MQGPTLGLTDLGLIHTAISLVAVAVGALALLRDKQIVTDSRLGGIYLLSTVLTCLTGFGIFQHGGFGKAHVLGILTLLVLVIAYGAGRLGWFGRTARYVEVVAYSTTFFFHMIPGFTESLTRLPLGAPLLADAEAPELKAITGVLLLLLIIGSVLQVRRLRHRAGVAGAAFA